MSTPLTKKERMQLPRIEMPERDADQRAASFEEVNLGLTAKMAQLEAMRCLECKRPKCVDGCPVGIQIDEHGPRDVGRGVGSSLRTGRNRPPDVGDDHRSEVLLEPCSAHGWSGQLDQCMHPLRDLLVTPAFIDAEGIAASNVEACRSSRSTKRSVAPRGSSR